MNTPKDRVADGAYVELLYKIIDKKSGNVLAAIEYPIGYVHGVNDILSQEVMDILEGHKEGDVVEAPIDGTLLFGPRDESLVFSDRLENVPEAYRIEGTSILTENEKGDVRRFYVTRNDGEVVTFDGNHPLCGRALVFRLDIRSIREATDEEREAGGAVDATPELNQILKSAVELP